MRMSPGDKSADNALMVSPTTAAGTMSQMARGGASLATSSLRVPAPHGTLLHEPLDGFRLRIVDHAGVACLHQTPRHTGSHTPQADHAELHRLTSEMPGNTQTRPAAARMSIASRFCTGSGGIQRITRVPGRRHPPPARVSMDLKLPVPAHDGRMRDRPALSTWRSGSARTDGLSCTHPTTASCYPGTGSRSS